MGSQSCWRSSAVEVCRDQTTTCVSGSDRGCHSSFARSVKRSRPHYRELSADAVIVAEDLLPSAVAELDLEHARAIVTDAGGWTSHTAIIARGLGIPAIVGLGDLYPAARTGDAVIVDSYHNEVLLHPAAETIDKYRSASYPKRSRLAAEASNAEATVTTDGIKVTLRANVELPAEFKGVAEYGAEGIGLYRSEFLLARPGVMCRRKQYRAYCESSSTGRRPRGGVRLFDLEGR